MGRPRLVVVAATCCLLLGALAAWLQAADRPSATLSEAGVAASGCRSGPTVDEVRLTLEVDAADDRSPVRESAEVLLSHVTQDWLAGAAVQLPLCLFANSATYGSGQEAYLSGFAQLPLAGYELAGDHLTVRFAGTGLSSSTSERQPDLDGAAAATTVEHDRRRLSIDVSPCRSAAGRLACRTSVPTQVELHVPDDQLRTYPKDPDPSPDPVSLALVTGSSPPASISSDAAHASTVFTWRLSSASERLAVAVPTTTRLSDVSSRHSTWGPVDVSWGYFATRLSILLPLVAAGIMLTRAGHRRVSRQASNLLLAFIALALGTSVYFYRVDQLVTAAVWTLVTFTIGDVRRKTLRGGATLGLLLSVAGTVGALPLLTSTGLLVTALTGTTAAVTQLRRAFLLLPRPGLRIRFWGLGPRLGRLAPRLESGAAVALLLGTALLLGDNIARAAVSAVRYRSILDSVGDQATELVAGVLANAVSDVTYVLLNSWAIFLLALVAQLLHDSKPDGPGVPLHERLAPTRPAVLAITLVLVTAAPSPVEQWVGFTLPVWLLTWFVLLRVVRAGPSPKSAARILSRERRELLGSAVWAERSRARLLATDSMVSSYEATPQALTAQARAHRQAFPDDDAAQLLVRGTGGSWLANGRVAAGLGMVIAVVPLSIYLWSAAKTAPLSLGYGGGLEIVLGVLTQVARWLAVAFAFGALYPVLPTRVGAAKGVVLALAWSVGSLLSELLGSWLGEKTSGLWLYSSSQVFLFLVALGLAHDFVTIQAAGGSWRRLPDLYRMQTWRQWVSYGVPVLLALIGVVTELRGGAGGKAAEQILAAVTAVAG